MALQSEPWTAAAAFFVTGILALLLMRRNRAFLAALTAGAVLYVLAIADYVVNDSAAVLPLYVAFAVVFVVTLAAIPFTGRRDEARVARPVAVQAAPPRAAPTPAAPTRGEALYYDYKGDVHQVIDVEGIGPVYAERLGRLGVETTARLCYEDPEKLARRLDVPVKLVRSWQSMGELAKVDGIGKQYAEALARAGVEGIQELKERRPDEIAAEVTRYLESLDSNVLGQKVSRKRVETWQTKARPMRRVRQNVPTV